VLYLPNKNKEANKIISTAAYMQRIEIES